MLGGKNFNYIEDYYGNLTGVTSGQLTGYLEYDYSGIGAWGIEDLNNTYVSAPAFFDVSKTPEKLRMIEKS